MNKTDLKFTLHMTSDVGIDFFSEVTGALVPGLRQQLTVKRKARLSEYYPKALLRAHLQLTYVQLGVVNHK